MKEVSGVTTITSYLFGLLVFTIGVLNLFLVHPVPGVVFLSLSLIYLPAVNALLKEKFNFFFPPVVKIILGFIIIWFTLGVSDLGDIIDNLGN